MVNDGENRESYTSWTDVERYLHSGHSTSFPLNTVPGPRVDYVVTDDRSIALHLELGPRQRLPHSSLPLVRIDEIAQNGIRMARLRLTQERLLRDFHDLLNAIADRVVAHRRTPEQAFQETVQAWSALLEQPRGLDAHRRIGLLGELTVLNSIADTRGWDIAVQSWKGPGLEEHDFGLPDHDIEVKTTSSERRRHTVHGLAQLTPVNTRALWLVSVQLTRGGAYGRTLAQSVTAVRGRITQDAPTELARFDALLSAYGWVAEVPDDERWSLRGAPLAFPVDDRMPRLETATLCALPESVRARIDDITYRIDLTDMAPRTHSGTPLALRAFRLP